MTNAKLKERIHLLEHMVQMAYRKGIIVGANDLGAYYEANLDTVTNGGYTSHEVEPVEDYTEEDYFADNEQLQAEESERELEHNCHYFEEIEDDEVARKEFLARFCKEYQDKFLKEFAEWKADWKKVNDKLKAK